MPKRDYPYTLRFPATKTLRQRVKNLALAEGVSMQDILHDLVVEAVAATEQALNSRS